MGDCLGAGCQKGACLGHGRGGAAVEAEGQPGEVEGGPRPLGGAAGLRFYFTRSGVRIRVDPKALARWKTKMRELTSRRWSIAMDERIAKINRFMTGWMGYFQLSDASSPFRDLEEWFRRRMRQIRWKEWKIPRARRANLRRLGITESLSHQWGNSSKGYWRIAGSAVLQRALPNSYWDDLGLLTFKTISQRLRSAR
nr:group II intron maturase-specific domain-containing protein [Streptomyces pluripotens]